MILEGHRFFLYSAIVMAVLNVAAFSFQHAMGRSSFVASPPLVHAHAITFFGWVTIYLAQNALASTGNIALHRRLGWIAAGWMVLMVVLGTSVTVAMEREGRVPFFFTPAYFLIMNPIAVLTFAGLGAAAIVLRRQTQWHRRLLYCGTATIMGPSFGRLLPVPFMIPWVGWGIFAAIMLFPLAGVIFDLRQRGKVHPAWWWGIGVMVAAQLSMDLIAYSPLGGAIYAFATAGSPGAQIAPFAYPKLPWLP